MANDLAAMIARIAAEMVRPDLALAAPTAGNLNGAAIRNAITTAISVYQKERWRFNETDPTTPYTFATTAGQSVYRNPSTPDYATINSSIFFIDYVNIAIGNTLQELSREMPEEQHLNIQFNNQSGQPSSYAYEGNSLILYPVPDQAYTIYVGGHMLLPAPQTDTEAGNWWMTWAELLIRSRAKYEIATHVTRNKEMALAMSPDPSENGQTYRAWKTLKAETNKITGRSRVRPMRW